LKVTYNWLKDFVDIKIPAPALAQKLTMAGLEVVSLEEKDGDLVFEIEITSNRPDWLSVVGIAREVSALTGARLKADRLKAQKSKLKLAGLKVGVADKKDCPLYTARIIRGVRVGPSPEWLKKRLELVGCRSVNNIVDITNYILFETGQPLHAFDLDKLSGNSINVRRAHPSEKILTIDGSEKALGENILVIADSLKPVAVAGVMGGKDTEVTFATKNILLEAAVFNALIVRRGRTALGLQSESSYRFERGIDSLAVESASLKAKDLIIQLSQAEEEAYKASGVKDIVAKKVILDIDKVEKILGLNIPLPKIKKILENLGFKVSAKSKNKFTIVVPSFRQDVSLEQDLIEEISRIFGFEGIPQTLPAVKASVTIREKRDLVQEIKDILTGLGLNESINYSLADSSLLKKVSTINKEEPILLMNPLNQEQGALRTTLKLGLIRSVAFNLNQKQDYVPLFEVASIFIKKEDLPQEELMLGLALSGAEPVLLESGTLKSETGLLNLKGILEVLLNRLGIKDYVFNSIPGALGAEVFIGDNKIGDLLKLDSASKTDFNIKNKDLFLAEVSLDKILSATAAQKKFTPLPKYPGITRDVSFILKEEISVKDIFALFKKSNQPLLAEIRVADYYKGKQIPDGYRGLTLSFYYSSGERTLTEEEVQPLHDSNCAILKKEFDIKTR
jgi:phenylalanyl-tRNA synthetase beta chain